MGCGGSKLKIWEFNPAEAGLEGKQRKKFDKLCRNLQIHQEDATIFYSVWRKIEPIGNNLISETDFITHLKIEQTPFLKRALTIVDVVGHHDPDAKNIDFIHYFLKLYQICALTAVGLDCFSFELYDADQSGIIDTRELIQLAKDMYGDDYEHDHRLKHTIDLITKDHPNTVTLQQFEHVILKHPLLTFPAHQAQKDLQAHTGGKAFWKKLMERRLLGHEQGAMYHMKHLMSNVAEIAEEIQDDVTGSHHKHKHHHHDNHEAHGKYVHHEHHEKKHHATHHEKRSSAALMFH